MIGGSGRCGTNLTKNILSKHSDVYSLPFEFRFIIDPEGIIDFYNSFSTTWSPFFADKKINNLKSFLLNLSNKKFFETFFSRIIKFFDNDGKYLTSAKYYEWELDKWFPNYTNHVESLINDLTEFKYLGTWPGSANYKINSEIIFSSYKSKSELRMILRKFIMNCISELLIKNDKTFFVEDNTWNNLFINELNYIIPDLKFINLIRDPRDVVLSFTNQRWTPKELEKSSILYRSIMEYWLRKREDLSNDLIYDCFYENLINNTENEVKKICDHIGLDFEDKMLNIDIYKSNVNKWQKQLDSNQISIIENTLGDLIFRLGYK